MWKEKVLNHHHEVPYKVLEKQYTFGDEKNENKIIHGDNLEALKSLLPQYEGKIKCIYIDPPYNTWNEWWVYNDNVNHPKIKKWLGDVVGKEWEDLSRHDKWLCMMYPRLKLLHKLLKDDWVIFISIDDNEQANLKLIMDEIFWKDCYIWDFIRKTKTAGNNHNTWFNIQHENTLIYAKTIWNMILRWYEKTFENYSNPDDDMNWEWISDNPTANDDWRILKNDFQIINPYTWKIDTPPKGRHRLFNQQKMQEYIESWKFIFKKSHPKDQRWFILKRYKKDIISSHHSLNSLECTNNDYLNQWATRDINFMFWKKLFEYSKPVKFLEILINSSCKTNDIILDSFAWSWTTAHAVFNLNKQDWWDRKFILIEMEDYAEDITANRIKKVVNGYGEWEKKVEWTGWGFSYYELGQPLFLDEENLNEAVGEDKLREYIWYTETKTPFIEPKKKNKYFLGTNHDADFYFFYEKNKATTLNHEFLSSLETKKNKQFVIYADMCLLSEEFMRKHNIIFKKIPRDITKF